MQNQVFFPQMAVDQWGIDSKIEFTGTELIVLSEGRKYKVTECVHIVTEVTGANDPNKLIGKVKSVAALQELGAEILEGSMIMGDNAYDVVPGWAGAVMTPFADHLLSPERMKAREGKTDIGAGPHSDEDLIKLFVEENS